MWNQRPKPGDTEDDLLSFQEEFLKKGTSSSASMVRKPGHKRTSASDEGKGEAPSMSSAHRDVVHLQGFPSHPPMASPPPPLKKSRFKASRESHRSVPTDDPEKDLESHDKSTAAILTDIIERDTRNSEVYFPRHSSQGFPAVLHRGSTAPSQVQSSTKSLFAQQMGRSPVSQLGIGLNTGQNVNCQGSSVVSNELDGDIDRKTSNILQGTSKPGFVSSEEVKMIHTENQARLSSMSEDEILTEQRKLLDSLDPKLVMFLRGKKTTTVEESKVDSSSGPGEAGFTGTKAVTTQQSDHPTEQERPNIPMELNKNWLHMDVVEPDKLAWMSELPVPRADNSKTGQTARFDFSGNVLATDCDLPVTLGLHHHGDQPERAGYTLEELFTLSRSSNIQQRSLALQTLARILTKAKAGELCKGVETAVLPVVVEAGIVFLARWAVDDSVDAVLVAGLSLLRAILVNNADEVALDGVFSWPGGVAVVSQCPDQSMEDTQDKESRSEETDAETLKQDLVSGMVTRMSILPRLHHFLSSWRPQAPSVLDVLAILTRITRHSQQTAYQVLIFPGLIETVVVEFLPTSWKPVDVTQPKSCVYGHPVPSAVRFLRTVAQAGRNMASILVSKYELLSRSMVYVAMDTSDLPLPQKEAVSLQTEVYRLWTVCLLYGLTTQCYIDLYPTLIQRLQRVEVSRCLTDQSHLGSAFIGVFRAVAVAAGANTPVLQRFDQNTPKSELLSNPLTSSLTWSSVDELITPIRALWDRLCSQAIENYQHQKENLEVIAAICDFMADYYHHRSKQAVMNPVSTLEDLETLSKVLGTFWKSVGFHAILSSLSSHSNLVSASNDCCAECTPSLPELTLVSEVRGHPIPVLTPHSVIGFITAFLKLALAVCKAQKGLIQSIVPVILNDSHLRSYLKRVTSLSRPSPLQTNYFTRYENYLHFYLIKLAQLQQVDGLDLSLYHSTALSLLIRLHHGDEHLAHDLLSTVIFNPTFIREGSSHELARAGLEDMDIAEDRTVHLRSATQCEVSAPRTQMLHDIVTSLSSARATYLSVFSDLSKEVQISRARHLGQVIDTQTFFTSHIGECLMPADWMFIPLVDLYNRSLKQGDEVCSSPDLVSRVADCLGWLYLLECWRGETLTPVSPTLRITRVMCVFLAGNDLFLDGRVQTLLSALLREYTRPHIVRRMDFDADIPGLTSFYDLYMSLLQQYLAVSFGDSLFGCYILLPLQQQHNVRLRKSVWGEQSRGLRTLAIPIQQMLVPLENYLEPEEHDPEMIRLYIQSLLSRAARPEWCPVLYLIAVHHVNRFIYSQDGVCTPLKHTIIKQISALHHQDLRRHLLFYKSAGLDRPYGMELYEELPAIRSRLLADLGVGIEFQHPNT